MRAQITLKTRDPHQPEGEERRRGDSRHAEQEVVIIDAHVDAWFEAPETTATASSVMLALARHFAKPENRPDRTLVFIASAGHHSPGINGPRAFVAANPDLAKGAVLMLNIEHVAQRNFSPARTTAADGYRQAVADSGEAPIYAGVINKAPFLDRLFERGVVATA